jgi:response regulator RpfG family c-di-GMP phosphodiesterase
MKLLAKSNGLELKVHSQIVSKTSLLLLNNISSKEIADRYSKTISYSALLHDIGKLTVNSKILNGKLKNQI